jgi:hypothetical protein
MVIMDLMLTSVPRHFSLRNGSRLDAGVSQGSVMGPVLARLVVTGPERIAWLFVIILSLGETKASAERV